VTTYPPRVGPCGRPTKTNEITSKWDVLSFYFKKVQLLFVSTQLAGPERAIVVIFVLLPALFVQRFTSFYIFYHECHVSWSDLLSLSCLLFEERNGR